MPGRIEVKLAELGITLPQPDAADRQLRALRRHRQPGGRLRPGAGDRRQDRDHRQGRRRACRSISGKEAARLCFINVLVHLKAACGGDLDRVRRVVRLGGFIASPPEFTQHAQVMNGASDLAVAVFGEAGRHARTTIGVPALPADAAVEVEGMFEIG